MVVAVTDARAPGGNNVVRSTVGSQLGADGRRVLGRRCFHLDLRTHLVHIQGANRPNQRVQLWATEHSRL